MWDEWCFARRPTCDTSYGDDCGWSPEKEHVWLVRCTSKPKCEMTTKNTIKNRRGVREVAVKHPVDLVG